MAHIDFLEQAIAQMQTEIERCLPPFEEALDLLRSIPAIKDVAGAAILAEIGTDMRRSPSAGTWPRRPVSVPATLRVQGNG